MYEMFSRTNIGRYFRLRNFSEKIDRVLTHKFFGLVILIAILLVVFQAIFSWATLPMDLLEAGFGALGDFVRTSMPEGLLTDLIVDGIIAGVGGIMVFLPQILLLFLFISTMATPFASTNSINGLPDSFFMMGANLHEFLLMGDQSRLRFGQRRHACHT